MEGRRKENEREGGEGRNVKRGVRKEERRRGQRETKANQR